MSAKISALTALTGANVADDDLLPIVDTSATATKKITWAELIAANNLKPRLFTADVAYQGALVTGIWKQATAGLVLQGVGSTYDVVILNQGGGIALAVPTTTRALENSMGNSDGLSTLIGRANINTTAVGNVGAGEDNLITYDLPANALSGDGKGVEIIAWGTTANNAAAKTLKIYFGSQIILTNSLTVNLAGAWRAHCLVFRTAVDAQDYSSQLITTGAAGVALNDVEGGTATEDVGAAITIKCTGEATSNNDIVQEGLLIKFLN
jgi:hypothetical protein